MIKKKPKVLLAYGTNMVIMRYAVPKRDDLFLFGSCNKTLKDIQTMWFDYGMASYDRVNIDDEKRWIVREIR